MFLFYQNAWNVFPSGWGEYFFKTFIEKLINSVTLWRKYAAAALKSAVASSAIKFKMPSATTFHFDLVLDDIPVHLFQSEFPIRMLINCEGETHRCSTTPRNGPCCTLTNMTSTRVGLSVAVVYLLEEDVVHDDHGRQVGVGAPHHGQLGGLRPLLHQRARVLRVRGVHGARVFRARVCRPQAQMQCTIITYYVIKTLHRSLNRYAGFLRVNGWVLRSSSRSPKH